MVHKNRNPLAWILLGILFLKGECWAGSSVQVFSFSVFLPFSRFMRRLPWISGFKAITNSRMTVRGLVFYWNICTASHAH